MHNICDRPMQHAYIRLPQYFIDVISEKYVLSDSMSTDFTFLGSTVGIDIACRPHATKVDTINNISNHLFIVLSNNINHYT